MSKKQSIQKLIEDNFRVDDQFDEETEDNIVFNDSVNKLLDPNAVEGFDSISKFKSKFFPVDTVLSKEVYGGKVVSRDRLYSDRVNSELEEDDQDVDGVDNNIDSDGDDASDTGDDSDNSVNDDECDISNYLNEAVADGKGLNEDESEIDDDAPETESSRSISVLNSGHISEPSNDIKKGTAVHNQLNLCSKLSEGRMKLQKCLILSNRLPKYENFNDYKSADTVPTIGQLYENVTDLIGNLLKLQNIVRKNSEEYDKIKGNIEEAEVSDEEEQGDQVIRKKRKFTDCSELLQEKFDSYIPYRNSVIQKWNDKTKVSTGKLAKSNFSAFDRPTLSQIEYILKDKDRLIKRTQLKRSQYNIIGENKNQTDNQVVGSEGDGNRGSEYDAEIFDDDDFYHKLLRDYIERKTVDVTDPVQVSRKWMELQKLRIKMKHKVDTRSTKGRKLRYNVHPKLVNFMVPVVDNMWNESAIADLYNSLFGKSLK